MSRPMSAIGTKRTLVCVASMSALEVRAASAWTRAARLARVKPAQLERYSLSREPQGPQSQNFSQQNFLCEPRTIIATSIGCSAAWKP